MLGEFWSLVSIMNPTRLLLAATASIISAGIVQYAGVNIAGLTFGTDTLGTTVLSKLAYPGNTGISQMQHFINDNGLNAFRLPVSWQYLTNGALGGTLNPTNSASYDHIIQGCIKTGAAMCIVDVHNYARWNNTVIGQGGPSNAQFASLWSQLATKYAKSPQVAFGVMNEPHDIDTTKWAATVQAAVTAIRQAGATQKILLPGNGWAHASALISTGSAGALNNITNPDGTTTALVFDIHQYLDSDGSGTHSTCVTDNSATLSTLGDWLRTNKRLALLTETGGGPDDCTCLQLLCQQFDTMNAYSDVYLGWLGWAAGMFATNYVLSMTPRQNGATWTNQPLVDRCLLAKFKSLPGAINMAKVVSSASVVSSAKAVSSATVVSPAPSIVNLVSSISSTFATRSRGSTFSAGSSTTLAATNTSSATIASSTAPASISSGDAASLGHGLVWDRSAGSTGHRMHY